MLAAITDNRYGLKLGISDFAFIGMLSVLLLKNDRFLNSKVPGFFLARFDDRYWVMFQIVCFFPNFDEKFPIQRLKNTFFKSPFLPHVWVLN